MIPRFQPWFGGDELSSLFGSSQEAVERFESAFASHFGCTDGLAFPYGRSALWALLSCLGFSGREVIVPAYTCTVVAHSIVLSGNIPRFVDIQLDDYNMDLDLVADAINEKTCAVVATHIFGYPLDLDRLEAIVKEAENKFGHKIWVIQDCAHSFGAEWNGRKVTAAPDLALFGLNISKIMSSIFGGMLTGNDKELMGSLRRWRDERFSKAQVLKSCKRAIYMMLSRMSFSPACYGLVHWLQNSTPFLKGLTNAYHLDDKIHFPPDYLDSMTPLEARVGQAQLLKYNENIRRRQSNAAFYDSALVGKKNLVLPLKVEGATYSHYPIRVANRDELAAQCIKAGIEVGKLIDYSVPQFPSYHQYTGKAIFSNSDLCSKSMINLPVHPGLSEGERTRIANQLLKS